MSTITVHPVESKKLAGTPQNAAVNTGSHFDSRIPTHQQLLYGFGDFGNGFMFDLGQAYLTKFWIDVVGIGPSTVAAIFSLTKIWDAFMDPIAGSIIDGRKSGPRGKFRPVMMISAVLLGIMTVVTFYMPSGLNMSQKVIYAFAAYMIWGLIYSFTNAPYGSLASVMSRNPQDRSLMATARQVGSVGAQFICGVAFVPLMLVMSGGKANDHGYLITTAIFAAIGVAMFAICYFGTKENVTVHRDPNAKVLDFKTYAKVVFTNGPLGAIVLMTLFTISAMNTNNAMMIFYAQYNLHNVGLTPILNFFNMGCAIIGVFMIPTLVKHFGQRKVLVTSFAIGVSANLINFLLPDNVITFTIFVSIGYAALAIPNGITWNMVSNAIDYGEWNTGMRREAITYAAFNFSRKLAQSLAAIISAGVLAATGYVAGHADASALQGIRSVMTLYPAVALLCAGLIIFFLYRLTDERFKEVAIDLDNGCWKNGKIGETNALKK
ncbi:MULTISPECIES: glycoside-pentoside-hexuronide (GPH):cation symporter [Lactococcus]|uniref:glycoside-pentoside-hexuronide (GPH):cation symporter n=1 Tax=Lactococcus TaxID=1357 RepID=UPI00071DF9E3|nr:MULTISPECIES: glycoside-pentoside-hexuronide (GPH):cation symporter [Lactococcus]MDN6779933.1 glycoside-pentoside-hexuronide (GPH):cation symporter [Lactobacillus sp.]KAF6611139.1 MFS transporter [Lactococcus sp. EKM201L]KAF6613975.1 MFS transporter [Lactococcus sp. EKM203L]KAF6642301.1 MFS transporter [Lactococcus sp. EKM501L]KAF6645080.1 MFS transporter [Lactococcus sp. EKM502L]